MSNELINLLREDIKQLSRDVKSTEEAWRDRSHELNDKIQLLSLRQAIQDKQIDALEDHSGLNALQVSVDKGFQGVNARLDKVNGRLDTHTGQIAAAAARADAQEKALDGLKAPLLATDQLSTKAKAAVLGGAGIGGMAVLHSLFEMVKTLGPGIMKLFGG